MKKGPILNETYYQRVLNCPDDRVIVHLYGSDCVMYEDFLSLLSQSYAYPGVWLSCGQHLDYWHYQKGMMDPKSNKNLRPMAGLGKAHAYFIPDILFIHHAKKEDNKRGRRLAFMAEQFKGDSSTIIFRICC